MVESRFKMKSGVPGAGFVLLFLLALSLVVAPKAYTADEGKALYESRCILCHGAKGDGNGHVSILPKTEKFGKIWKLNPRDFTVGAFKWRTTPSGCLPLDADLAKIVENGISRTYMPSNADLSRDEINGLVQYIKTFSPRWVEEKGDTGGVCTPIVINKPAFVGSPESVAKGAEVWKKMKCAECHGDQGKGDGPKSESLKDDSGHPIMAFDFTSCAGKGGVSPERTYAAYTTGIDGTGMPSYADSLNEDDRWNLVSYTLKLMHKL
ncbi:MAG: c-type cytochrome [Nitrospirae bacterium]|nr:c-type cytochrome [Nitrospirota bacterium]